ncbi:retrotransposon protein, putative, ty1-copia subclass [Tanacetum coccineum]
MKAYLDQMDRLGYPIPLVLGVNLILTSLSKDYDQFVQNYNMHGMGKTIPELHAMLKLAEKAYDLRYKISLPTKKEHPAKDTECHHCHKLGHWKRNCPLYLAELKKNKANTSDTSCIFTIELYSFPKTNYWIYDTGCGNHICNTIQGLWGIQKLNTDALDLYVSNGNSVAVEAIMSFDLILPSGMVLVLDNCHFAPSITRVVISLSRLWDNGFLHKFTNYGAIFVSKDNLFYFNAIPRDGIFEIDMHNHISNERSIYTCSNKKSKHNLDYTFLWHYRLGHINKICIAKLQYDGLLKSIDDESFDICVSCIYGKMARNSFTHESERANDLLGLIHSDVCGPFRTTSREGANYYVTFTDDFSRYGYVYLIKHKHEVFEMFKAFQNEVEHQLGKTIKALRSDRGGEYLSQEFLDHLRSCRIISQLTPPYTPQHNESAACILNMVPTKKVDKTPYEIWHGKVSNLSYLKNSLISQEASGNTIDFDEIQRQDAQPSENTSEHRPEVEHEDVETQTDVNPVRRFARIPQAPERYGFYVDAEEHELGDHGESANYRAALSDPESDKWLEAINAEMQSMKDNQVWKLVDLLPNCKTVGSKWIFKKKTDMDGNIHTYKARLVANGFTQTYVVDYEETFSPVADIKSIRILIANNVL